MNPVIGMISNPRSDRNLKSMRDVREWVQRHPQILHAEIEEGQSASDVLNSLLEQSPDILICNSGDGTMQGILTGLFSNTPRKKLPFFAIFARGTTNMNAHDVGLKGAGIKTLDRLLAAMEDGSWQHCLETRQILKVNYRDDDRPQYGMFMGGLAIYEAIQLCKRNVHSQGFRGDLSHGIVLARLLWAAATNSMHNIGIDGQQIRLRIDHGEILDENLLLLLCTTLDKLVLRSRPFWNQQSGELRFTRISYPPEKLVRSAWKVLYGDEPRRLPETGYRSCGARQIELWLDKPFTIDGEFFEPARARPVKISAANSISFIRL